MKTYSRLDKDLLNNYQHNFPLVSKPYAQIAEQLGSDEDTILKLLQEFKQDDVVTRVGPVFQVNRIGVSTLAAMSVPDSEVETVANIISNFKAVNHNYKREHDFNLWFVATAPTHPDLQHTIAQMEDTTGYEVMQLPMLKEFHIDLGFEIRWE